MRNLFDLCYFNLCPVQVIIYKMTQIKSNIDFDLHQCCQGVFISSAYNIFTLYYPQSLGSPTHISFQFFTIMISFKDTQF